MNRYATLVMVAISLAACESPDITEIEGSVLSSPRPDLVSGGDTLIKVTGAQGRSISISVNGSPADLRIRESNPSNTIALIEGLRLGKNDIVVRAGRASARLTVVNHPKDGPILSGPHLTPYECRTVEAGLGMPIDGNCNIKTRYDWFYRATDKAFKPLPSGALPSDLSTTTTIDGRTVPYIVRVEAGTINRTIYKIAILDDPSNAPGPDWRPGPGWNGRLTVSFGFGTGNKYHQGTLDPKDGVDVFNDRFLSRGFAHLVASEFVNHVHSNPVLQGEALMMLKEHFIEQYGQPRWTTGSGGSGGSVQQLGIAQIYPGLLDGIMPSASFPDNTVFPVAQCVLVKGAMKRSGRTFSVEKQQEIEGHYPGMCDTLADLGALYSATEPVMCDLKDTSLVYDPKRNPRGPRCGLHETLANIVGRDPETGFRLHFEDNVGVQYGLKGLNDGRLTVDEFLDVNENIGGFDVDGNWQAARMQGDPAAIRRAYESGIVNSGGGGLAVTPIVQFRTYTDQLKDLHDRFRDLVVRDRLVRTNGDAENHVIWLSSIESKVDLSDLALDTMTRWLDAITTDPAPLSHEKVVRARPAEATDAYWDAADVKHPEKTSWDPTTAFNKLMPYHTDPILQAGGPTTADVLKCRLKPIDFRSYSVAFSAEQQARLRRIFPEGVCDYIEPGIGQVPLKGTYQAY
ncbi:hypothetical protein D187_008916 [Cystobacter fuscus DSM 2262]|uniref:DUF6351 domain-containing protein n=1 Tax=Cystobacter fuscus (strain ATCC 25194 / DSM 2262 / NBRC 100088 / M29) TaxID=1242864 RepID=S9R1G8_CYSF2|nr:DUF6351 family protein [Cystobacter fuscus]EPX62728.1 hypothetical protein D187_008916 [Cystobacter fuscus DSM 2262]